MKRWFAASCVLVLAAAGWMLWRWLHPAPLDNQTHVLIDKSFNQLYLFNDGQLVKRFVVSTGQERGLTPEGRFTIVNRETLDEDSDSAFGSHWLGLSAPPSSCGRHYGIHGTDEPHLIGQHVSAGCIRMAPADIIELYHAVKEGTGVWIRSGPSWLWHLGAWVQRQRAAESDRAMRRVHIANNR